MTKKNIAFSTATTSFYFDASFDHLEKLVSRDNTFIITDENIFSSNKRKFKGWNTIVIKPGEEHKTQHSVDNIIGDLVQAGANRKSFIVGVGGGVITDMAGYVAGIYMRGVQFGFVPTSILAMVDASIGGKNGVDVGVYKNMVGLIHQPSFLLYDYSLLRSLPKEEWVNGFAEIIKHACIKDAAMFRELETNSLKKYQDRKVLVCELIQRNAILKTKVVQQDEFEKGDRKLLNFGHTLGHALENQYELSHGQAISIGMTYACNISEQITGFKETDRVIKVLEKYGLPTYAKFDKQKVFNVLKMDKKRERKEISYVLLEKIGKGLIKTISLDQLEK